MAKKEQPKPMPRPELEPIIKTVAGGKITVFVKGPAKVTSASPNVVIERVD